MKTGMDLVKEQSRDSLAWSKAFNDQLIENGEQPVDPELLHGWFANAMMSMHDSIFNNEIKILEDGFSGQRNEALGWMYAEACSLADKGLDIREIEVPEIMGRADEKLKAL